MFPRSLEWGCKDHPVTHLSPSPRPTRTHTTTLLFMRKLRPRTKAVILSVKAQDT